MEIQLKKDQPRKINKNVEVKPFSDDIIEAVMRNIKKQLNERSKLKTAYEYAALAYDGANSEYDRFDFPEKVILIPLIHDAIKHYVQIYNADFRNKTANEAQDSAARELSIFLQRQQTVMVVDCPSYDIEPQDIQNNAEYRSQARLFHPDNNPICESKAKTKFVQLTVLKAEFDKKQQAIKTLDVIAPLKSDFEHILLAIDLINSASRVIVYLVLAASYIYSSLFYEKPTQIETIAQLADRYGISIEVIYYILLNSNSFSPVRVFLNEELDIPQFLSIQADQTAVPKIDGNKTAANIEDETTESNPGNEAEVAVFKIDEPASKTTVPEIENALELKENTCIRFLASVNFYIKMLQKNSKNPEVPEGIELMPIQEMTTFVKPVELVAKVIPSPNTTTESAVNTVVLNALMDKPKHTSKSFNLLGYFFGKKQDEPKQDEPKQDEPKQDEPKQDEPKQDEPKQDGPKQDEPKQAETSSKKLRKTTRNRAKKPKCVATKIGRQIELDVNLETEETKSVRKPRCEAKLDDKELEVRVIKGGITPKRRARLFGLSQSRRRRTKRF
jgi:hypothetical protein